MLYLVDTGLLIRHLRGQKSTVQLLRGLSKNNRLGISIITRCEVQAGAHPSEHYITQKFLSRFVNFELDKRAADKAGELVYKSRQSNNPILMPDAIIAATSVVHSLTLITFNAQDFKMVAGLKIHPLSK